MVGANFTMDSTWVHLCTCLKLLAGSGHHLLAAPPSNPYEPHCCPPQTFRSHKTAPTYYPNAFLFRSTFEFFFLYVLIPVSLPCMCTIFESLTLIIIMSSLQEFGLTFNPQGSFQTPACSQNNSVADILGS